MKTKFIATALTGALAIISVYAVEKTPGFNQKIPEKIMTPDTVKTWRPGKIELVN